ncbi:NHL repeat protein [compost metagenome]
MSRTLACLLAMMAVGGCSNGLSRESSSVTPIVTVPTQFAIAAVPIPKFKLTTLVRGFGWQSLAANPLGKVYVIADRRIFQIGSNSEMIHFSGSTHWRSVSDGGPTTALFMAPQELAFGPDGMLYVSDTGNVRKVDTKGYVTTVAGTLIDESRNTNSGLTNPSRITVRKDGTIYLLQGNEIKKVFSNGNVETMPSNSHPDLTGIAFDSKRNTLYVSSVYQIFKVGPNGSLDLIAGKEGGALGDPYADGKGKSVSFGHIRAITVDEDGNLFTVEQNTSRVRMVSPTGQVTTVAGSGFGRGVRPSPDGPGLKASLLEPKEIKADKKGNLYIIDENGIRKLTRLN